MAPAPLQSAPDGPAQRLVRIRSHIEDQPKEEPTRQQALVLTLNSAYY